MDQLLRWQAITDLIALTAAIYLALLWARPTRALRIVLLLPALDAGSLGARHFEMIITSWVLGPLVHLSLAGAKPGTEK